MKKLLLIIYLLIPFNAISAEKTKEERLQNMFLKIFRKIMLLVTVFTKLQQRASEKQEKIKNIIDGLEKGADVTLKFNHDLGEVLGMPPKIMAKKIKIKLINSLRLQRKILLL